MRKERIAFHLTETDTTRTFATFHRLMGEVVDGTGRTHLVLVGYHVSETLVVDDSDIDIGLHLILL